MEDVGRRASGVGVGDAGVYEGVGEESSCEAIGEAECSCDTDTCRRSLECTRRRDCERVRW